MPRAPSADQAKKGIPSVSKHQPTTTHETEAQTEIETEVGNESENETENNNENGWLISKILS